MIVIAQREKLNASVTTAITAAEKTATADAARAAGLSVSAWTRQAIRSRLGLT